MLRPVAGKLVPCVLLAWLILSTLHGGLGQCREVKPQDPPLSDHAGSTSLLCMAVPQLSTRQPGRQCPQTGGSEDG